MQHLRPTNVSELVELQLQVLVADAVSVALSKRVGYFPMDAQSVTSETTSAVEGIVRIQAAARGVVARKANARRLAVQRKRAAAANATRATHARRRLSRVSRVGTCFSDEVKQAREAFVAKANSSAAAVPPLLSRASSNDAGGGAAAADGGSMGGSMGGNANALLATLLEMSRQQTAA